MKREKVKIKLTDKEELFCLAYTGEAKFNATEAARIAGYDETENALRVTGHRKLTKANTKERIKELTEQRLKDAGYQVDRVIREIIDLAFSDITDFTKEDGTIEIKRGEQPTAAIKELKYKDGKIAGIKLHAKCNFVEMLSKLLDMKSGDENINLKGTLADFLKESINGKKVD